MTAKLAALQRLHDAVVEDTLPEAVLFGVHNIHGHWSYETGLSADHRRLVCRAFQGSLDAAKALHEALLPGHSWDIWRSIGVDGVRYYGCNLPGIDTAYNADPARALLIAIIKALMAQEGE